MKGIQKINHIAGLGGNVPISTIDLIAKRKRKEEGGGGGAVVPTTDEYSSFEDEGWETSTQQGDVFQSLLDSDVIISLIGNSTGRYIHFQRVNTNTEAIAPLMGCTDDHAYCEYIGEALDASDCITLYYTGTRIRGCKYNVGAAGNFHTGPMTSKQMVGFCKTNSGMRFLATDGKLYSTLDYLSFTQTNDLSSIIPSSVNWKSCAYNSTDNYLYVLDTGTNKLYTIDLDTNTKIGEITPTDTLKGIVYHKGRITYCLRVGLSALKTVVLKNSDDA